jgi:multiple antibiotic resistance protein
MVEFWLCFIPLFVAVDAVGVLPMFVSLTEGFKPPRVKAVVLQSVLTALVVALAFLTLGPAALRFIGITVPDFMIAGGLLLLVISLNDLLSGQKKRHADDADSIGAVPIGVPLITGPAVLTTCVVLAATHGKPVTAAALSINIALAGAVFLFATPITRFLGRSGTKTISKVASLFLAAIAIMLMRKGLVQAIALAGK